MDERPPRRVFLKLVVIGGSGAIGVAVGGAGAVQLLDPVLSTRGNDSGRSFVRVARLDGLPEGEPRKVAVVGDETDAWTRTTARTLGSVWLVRHGDTVTAWSAICPHLGCAVALGDGETGFACPCHDSKFGLDGRRVSGPAPRDMDRLDARVVEGFVEIRWQRFLQGKPEREVVADAASPCASRRSRGGRC